jgi:hypothetical protein
LFNLFRVIPAPLRGAVVFFVVIPVFAVLLAIFPPTFPAAATEADANPGALGRPKLPTGGSGASATNPATVAGDRTEDQDATMRQARSGPRSTLTTKPPNRRAHAATAKPARRTPARDAVSKATKDDIDTADTPDPIRARHASKNQR